MRACIVDAFTREPFKGNPAGVCLPKAPLTDADMLRIAQEFNLSETAFIRVSGTPGAFSIRYFSPKMEIPLCGHATLAAAKVVFTTYDLDAVTFTTRDGLALTVRAVDGLIAMDFPAYETTPSWAPSGLLRALGLEETVNVCFNEETSILLVEIASPVALIHLDPKFDALVRSHNAINGVLVTAPGGDDGFDFHSRYFWPWSGTNEDPVTGATHTFLGPYWAERLGKTTLRSFQSSERTGSMEVTVHDGGVQIRGEAVIVFDGRLALPMG